MKFRYLLLVIVFIIIAHAVVLFICFHGDNTPKTEVKKTAEVQGKDASAGLPSASAEVKPVEAQMRTEEQAKPQQLPEKAKVTKKYYPPFNYRYVWSGDIPGIPDSAAIRAGILVDADTGNVIWEKNGKQAYPIASMTKIMTLLLACEDIASGRNGISLQSKVQVSRAASQIGGSQVWLDPKETFTLEELLKAVAIKSANDAAYLVGEYLGGGDIASFIERMNSRALELGMKKTKFYNSSGLPEKQLPNNSSSPEDMAHLAEYALNYTDLMQWASTVKTNFRPQGTKGHLEIINHNNLLPGRKYPAAGVDGLKTGFINKAGYCVTVTCLRSGHRMVAVVMGAEKAKIRDLFARKLLDWGYAYRANPAASLEQTRKLAQTLKNRKPAVQRKKTVVKKKTTPARKTSSSKKKSPK